METLQVAATARAERLKQVTASKDFKSLVKVMRALGHNGYKFPSQRDLITKPNLAKVLDDCGIEPPLTVHYLLDWITLAVSQLSTVKRLRVFGSEVNGGDEGTEEVDVHGSGSEDELPQEW